MDDDLAQVSWIVVLASATKCLRYTSKKRAFDRNTTPSKSHRAAKTQAKAMPIRPGAKQTAPGVFRVVALASQTEKHPEIVESSTNGRFVGRCQYFLGL